MRHIEPAIRLLLLALLAAGTAASAEGARPWARRNVAIVVYDQVEILDFAGPMEVFTAAGNGAFRVFTVAPTHAPVLSQGVLTIRPEFSVDDSPAPDILVLPGGDSRGFSRSEAGMAWVRKVAGQNELSMSVCSGAFILARLGLLDGRPATTHWGAVPRLRSAFPKVQVQTGVRFVDTGRIVTTAGVSAGIDGALHVVQRLLGDDVAWETARYMQYDAWEPKESATLTAPAKEALRALVFQDGARAVSLLTAAAARTPRDPLVLSRLGRAQLLRGAAKEGVATLESAVALGDVRPITLIALGDAQLTLGANAAAEQTFSRLLDERGTPSDAYQLACAQGRQGKVDAALASLTRAVQLGFHDQALAESDDDLRAVRSDARFAGVFGRNDGQTRR
ncbi:MAG: DJ-1/PfpI family protein [Myxococcaceae bacterium]